MFTNKAVLNRGGNGKGKSPFWVRGLESTETHYDDRALAVFHTDSLIPNQFHNTYKRRDYLAPEKTLMLAMLQDAVICFQDHIGAHDKKKRALFLDAEEWILDKDRRYFYSFENVCESLGFAPSYLRQGLMRWKAAVVGTRHARRLAS